MSQVPSSKNENRMDFSPTKIGKEFLPVDFKFIRFHFGTTGIDWHARETKSKFDWLVVIVLFCLQSLHQMLLRSFHDIWQHCILGPGNIILPGLLAKVVGCRISVMRPYGLIVDYFLFFLLIKSEFFYC